MKFKKRSEKVRKYRGNGNPLGKIVDSLLEVWLQNVFGHAVAQFVEPICECHNVW
jgi:hypothetical protein